MPWLPLWYALAVPAKQQLFALIPATFAVKWRSKWRSDSPRFRKSFFCHQLYFCSRGLRIRRLQVRVLPGAFLTRWLSKSYVWQSFLFAFSGRTCNNFATEFALLEHSVAILARCNKHSLNWQVELVGSFKCGVPREVHNIIFTQATIKEVIQTGSPQVVKSATADTSFALLLIWWSWSSIMIFRAKQIAFVVEKPLVVRPIRWLLQQ